MLLEARVERLESHFDSLDSAVRSLIKITEETHKVMLENQRENRIRFDKIDRRLAEHDCCFDKINKRLAEHDKRFGELDQRLDKVDQRLAEHDQRFDKIDQRFDKIDQRFDKIEDTLAIILNALKK